MDIASIKERIALTDEQVAKALFPNNNHPLAAYKRLVRGESEITLTQAVKLAQLAGCTVDEVAHQGWSKRAEPDHLVLAKGNIRALYYGIGRSLSVYNIDTGEVDTFHQTHDLSVNALFERLEALYQLNNVNQ